MTHASDESEAKETLSLGCVCGISLQHRLTKPSNSDLRRGAPNAPRGKRATPDDEECFKTQVAKCGVHRLAIPCENRAGATSESTPCPLDEPGVRSAAGEGHKKHTTVAHIRLAAKPKYPAGRPAPRSCAFLRFFTRFRLFSSPHALPSVHVTGN